MPPSNRLDRWISPSVLFLCGLAVMPAYLFQRLLIPKLILLAVFIAMGVISGRRMRPLGNLLFFAAVMFFNLLTPSGRVVFSVGPLDVTEEALKGGALKALSFTGLYHISTFAVHPRIRFPGRLGYLLSRTFAYFHLLLQSRGFRPRKPLESLDAMLLALDGSAGREAPADPAQTTAGGLAITLGLLFLSWGLGIATWTGLWMPRF